VSIKVIKSEKTLALELMISSAACMEEALRSRRSSRTLHHRQSREPFPSRRRSFANMPSTSATRRRSWFKWGADKAHDIAQESGASKEQEVALAHQKADELKKDLLRQAAAGKSSGVEKT
jgi:hypothetical protein